MLALTHNTHSDVTWGMQIIFCLTHHRSVSICVRVTVFCSTFLHIDGATLPTVNIQCSLQNKGHSRQCSSAHFIPVVSKNWSGEETHTATSTLTSVVRDETNCPLSPLPVATLCSTFTIISSQEECYSNVSLLGLHKVFHTKYPRFNCTICTKNFLIYSLIK